MGMENQGYPKHKTEEEETEEEREEEKGCGKKKEMKSPLDVIQ